MFGIPVYFKRNPQYCQEIVLFSRLPTAQANLSLPVNDVSKGSPSRMRRVRRISFGMTIRPRSSTRRTIPVAFINLSLLALRFRWYCLQEMAVYAIYLFSSFLVCAASPYPPLRNVCPFDPIQLLLPGIFGLPEISPQGASEAICQML